MTRVLSEPSIYKLAPTTGLLFAISPFMGESEFRFARTKSAASRALSAAFIHDKFLPARTEYTFKLLSYVTRRSFARAVDSRIRCSIMI